MKYKVALSTGAALGLLTCGATAQSNESYIDQLGDGNSALITQSGNRNIAGGEEGTLRILQRGDDHKLTIDQAGDDNRIGTVFNGINQGQTGNSNRDGNVLSISQQTNDNYVNVVSQGDTRATATITQDGGDGNVLTYLRQDGNDTLGNDHTALISQIGTGNWIGLWNHSSRTASTGTGVQQFNIDNDVTISLTGDYNRLDALVQRGNDNVASVSAEGNRNNIWRITQGSTAALTSGSNSVDISLDGDDNGSSLAAAGGGTWGSLYRGVGHFTADSPAALVVVPGTANGAPVDTFQSSAQQYGAGNSIGYSVTGSQNQFGFLQGGDNNQLNGVVGGSQNEIASVQIGDGNIVDFIQDGDGNNAGFDIVGSGNQFALNQDGSGNKAGFDVDGSNNWIAARQDGTTNQMNLSIQGSGNNMVGLSDAFTGAALTARNVAVLEDATFRRGSLFQDGDGNKLGGSLDGAPFLVNGNNNSFATFQDGNNNTIVGSIDGSSNQAVVVQFGNGNMADMTQVGSGNNLGINQ